MFGIGRMLKSFLHPERGYDKALQQYDQYYNQGQNAISPYMKQGQEVYPHLSGAMQALLNPQQLQNEWINSYETSPYAMDLMEEATNQGLDAASSMGLMGSSPALEAIQRGTTNIYNADRGQYLADLMQKYMTGAQLAQGIYGTGFNAAGQYGQNAMNQGQRSAEMAFGKANAPGQMLNDLLKTGTYAYMTRNNPWSTTGGS